MTAAWVSRQALRKRPEQSSVACALCGACSHGHPRSPLSQVHWDYQRHFYRKVNKGTPRTYAPAHLCIGGTPSLDHHPPASQEIRELFPGQRGQVPWLAGLRKKARCAWTPGVCLGAPRGGEPGHFCPPGTLNADVALLQTESRGPAELPRWKTGQSVLSARSQEPAVPWTRLPHAGEGPDPPPPAAARPERPEQGRRREALSPSQPSPAGSLSAAQSPADLVGRGQNARGAASPLPRVRPPRASEPSALWVWGALCWPFLRPAGNWVLDVRSGERGTARGGGDTASLLPVRRKPQGGWACVFHASFCSPSEGVCPARTTAAQPAGPVLWLPLEFTVASGNPSIKII